MIRKRPASVKASGFLEKQPKIRLATIKPNDKALWRALEKLEYEVFVECGYLEANADQRVIDYDPYAANSEFLAALAGGGGEEHLAGAIRAVYAPDQAKMAEGLFPTVDNTSKLKIFPEKYEALMKMDPRTIVDMAAMFIPRHARNAIVSKMLCTRVTTRAWEKKHVRYGLAAIDTGFYKRLVARGYPYIDLGPSVDYMGSASTATIVDSLAVPKGMQKFAIPFFMFRGFLQRGVGKD